jgi:hypothetical protein
VLADPPKHLLDTPAVWEMPPLCDEGEFAELIQDMVDDEAPRLFAIVQEYGERVDAVVAAWGMWFGDRVVAFSDDGGMLVLRSVENAMRMFRGGSDVTPRLCWAGLTPAQHNASS